MRNKDFNPKALIVAREARLLSQLELADKLGIPQSTLSKIENGYQFADDELLKKFVSILDFPQDFFCQEMEIYPPNLHYRKKKDTTPKILSYAEAIMNIYRNNIQTLLKSVELPYTKLPIFNETNKATPQQAAKYLREFWKVPKGPIDNLTKLIEDKGIIVLHMDYLTEKIDGRSMVSVTGNYIIFLNSKLSGDRLRFTLAHELAHIILHIYSQEIFEVDTEKEAMLFASEFLMPEDEIKPHLLGKLTIAKLADLKRFWKVSMQAILHWAGTLKAVTYNQSRFLWSQFSTLRIKAKEPIDIPVEKPSLLKEVIAAFIQQLAYTKEDLADLLNLSFDFFKEKYLQEDKNILRIIR